MIKRGITITGSEEEMERVAGEYAEELGKKPEERWATVVALSGELGAGKTNFARGFIKELGGRGRVTSPTFVIMRSYELEKGPWKRAYHIDAYRLKSGKELAALEFGKIKKNPENVILIEWPERVRGVLPRGTRKVNFRHLGGERREIRIGIK